jgi:Flp pilus assembly protein TadG
MVRGIKRRARRFHRSKRGVIALLFAILLPAIMGLMAVAVDLSQFLVMKQQLVAAVDAAALDVGNSPALSDADATAEAQAFIAANYPAVSRVGTLTSMSVTRTTSTVAITANATMNTSFLKIIGYNTLDVVVGALISVKQSKLELVLVLDNTGSMSNLYGGMSGIEGLKTAATTLVNTLFANDPTLRYVKIGVVPFTAAVNVGTQYANASWLDAAGAGSLTRENLNVPNGQGLIWLANKLTNVHWGGCVRARTEPYDVQETTPAAGSPETLYTPYFAPSEPSGGYVNHYLSDGTFPNGTTAADKQWSIAKYTNGSATGLPTSGPNYSCVIQPIIRLTNNQTSILSEINSMTASGSTVIPVGLMWGWHVLSPNGPFGDAVAYTDTDTIKAIILVTDGQNDVQGTSTSPTNGFNKSHFSAYGYLANRNNSHLNIYALPNNLYGIEDQANYNLDLKETQICNNIKAVTDVHGNAGRVVIYTVGFGNSINSRSLSLLQQCASSPSNFFYNPTSESLITTFQQIAIGLSQLRVSH